MADPYDQSSLLRELQRTARRVVSDGTLWCVYELPASVYDRRQGSSLVFESDTAVRRVRGYAAEWRELSDEDLMQLSWSA